MVINIIFFWLLVVFGVIVSLYNWIIVFNCVIKSKNSSCIPLLGGGAIVLAMNLPGIDMEEYESIPLLLDYGCIPLFVHTFFFFFFKMLRGLFNQGKRLLDKWLFLFFFFTVDDYFSNTLLEDKRLYSCYRGGINCFGNFRECFIWSSVKHGFLISLFVF